VPWLFGPLYAATLAGEWSLVRSRAHYPSDIFAGAAISVVIALVAWRMWPPDRVAFPGPEEAPDGPGLQSQDPAFADHTSRHASHHRGRPGEEALLVLPNLDD